MQVAWAEKQSEFQAGIATATEDGIAIEVQDLVKTYSSGDLKVQALRGVSLQVKEGEMVEIMGP